MYTHLIYLAFKSEDIIYGQRQKEGKSKFYSVCITGQLLGHKYEVPIFPHTPAGGLPSISARTPKALHIFPTTPALKPDCQKLQFKNSVQTSQLKYSNTVEK